MVIAVLASTAVGGSSQAAPQAVESYARLGQGHLKSMQWEAWGEVTHARDSKGSAEETCISIQTLERTEGNESTTCGSPEAASFEEIVRSSYGVVAAAMYASEADRVVICLKGGKRVKLPLKAINLRLTGTSPTRSYSYFARGFAAKVRIKWMVAIDSGGKNVTAGRAERPCK
jgi:hypothetical protein